MPKVSGVLKVARFMFSGVWSAYLSIAQLTGLRHYVQPTVPVGGIVLGVKSDRLGHLSTERPRPGPKTLLLAQLLGEEESGIALDLNWR